MKKNSFVCFIFTLGILAGLNSSAAVPTYKSTILPLTQKYCGACHGDGSESGNLLDYKTAVNMKDAISKAVTVDKSMPMGANGKKITADERSLFGQWVAAGTPLGDDAPSAPIPPPSSAGPTYKSTILPLIQKYCAGCHGDGSASGNLTDYKTALSMKEDRKSTRLNSSH